MFDDNNIEDFDLMMKSILDEAQEVVPERVWEGVSAGLDKVARRKAVILWWRRAAVGIAAAAAVVLGVFFTYNNENELVPVSAGGDMIAVVETAVPDSESEEAVIPVMMAESKVEKRVLSVKEVGAAMDMANEPVTFSSENETIGDEIIENEAVEYEYPSIENEPSSVGNDIPAEPSVEKKESAEYFPEDWGEEETRGKSDVSIVLSGLTGTNNTLSQNRIGPMKSPAVTPAPTKTGIQETSTKSSFGIPLSFGAGVKIGLSSRWSIGTGLNYTFLSRQFFGTYNKVDADGSVESRSSDISNHLHYIGIPVNAFYDVVSNDRINFYTYFGGTAEKCISNSYTLMGTAINHKEKVSGVQFSANAGIGVEFMLGSHLGFYIDPSVRYYFKNKTQPKSIRTVQPLMLGFEVGLRVNL